MFIFVRKRLSLKMMLALVACLAVIFGLFSWYLVESRKQVLEKELFDKGQMAVRVGAEAFGRFLEELIEGQHITLGDLFDENYQLITEGPLANSAIPKYHTRYDRYFDDPIQQIEDAFLEDSMVVFAVIVDRNGYLPTHNSRYSKPLTGDPQLDRVGNRTKRIFNDPVGIAAARYTGDGETPILKQVYPRDTGVLMWDISTPIMVYGKHWGAFRIGLSMDAIESSVVQLQQTVLLATIAALVGCALLVMFLVSSAIRPLQMLTGVAEAIAGGHRKEKIEIKSDDEVGVLVDAFNSMVEALETTTVSRDFYDMLLRSMHDLLIVSGPNGEVVSVNQATCLVLGYDVEHIKTHNIQDIVELRDSKEDWFAAQLSVRQNFTNDVFLANCDGQHFPMAMSCSPLQDADNAITGFIFTFQDNSERIEAERATAEAFAETHKLNEELQQINLAMESTNEELAQAYSKLQNSQVQILQQEKMASIGQLAAGVAHEINNPMGFITSNLGTLDKYIERLQVFLAQQSRLIEENVSAEKQEDIKEQHKKLKIDYLLEDSRDLLEESLDGASRVKVIVQNLKTFSRLDQEDEHEADINECLDTTINIAWNELKYKVTLEKDFAPLPLLHCYPQKLNQVFMNLLVNAAQAIDEKGTINLRTWSDEVSIFVEIRDTGCGIPAESLSRIFEPFYTTKEVGKGTGLGMSISYEIIKEHGGEIQVDSVVGQGTTFTIHLPLSKKEDSTGDS